jgi:hypothetical protein
VTAADFEVSGRLRADRSLVHVSADAKTEVEGDVTLTRRQTRRGVPAKLESGEHYRDIVIDQRLVGEMRRG